MRRLGAIAIAALLGATPTFAGELCGVWSEGETLGTLDARLVPEASGLAVSLDHPGMLYHVNDSGGGPFLYSSAFDGSELRRLRLDVPAVFDTEALAIGRVDGESTLFVGDIGDNEEVRSSIQVLAVRERDIGPEAAPVTAALEVRYPDGPKNAEAMMAGPDGALYIVTKSWTSRSKDPAPARVYRLGPRAWAQPKQAPAVLQFLGDLDLPVLATRERAVFSDTVTDAAMTADGKRLLVLTYGQAWELALDLSGGRVPPAAEMLRGRDYEPIRLKPILGKETIAYLPGERSFVFGKEFKPDSRPSVLIRVACVEPVR